METKFICPYCNEDYLIYIEADEPWHDKYMICPVCDSTFVFKEEVE